MSQSFEQRRQDQDSEAAGTDDLQSAEEDRRRRLAVLHALAEQARQAPRAVDTRQTGAPAARGASRPRHTPALLRGARRRLGQPSWRVSLLLVVLLLLVGGSVSFALHAHWPGSSSQTTERPVASVTALYFAPDVPWTTVSVDNRSVSMGMPGEQAPYVLPAGRHLISWAAAPFPDQQCVLSSPAQTTDTCPAAFAGVRYVPGKPAADIVRLEEESNDLPPATVGALASSVQTALTASEQASSISRGEHVYLGGSGVADGTYTATTRIQLDTEGVGAICQLDLLSATRDCDLVSKQCLPLCSLDYGERQSGGAALPSDQWLAIAAVYMWRDYESTGGMAAYPEQAASSGEVAFDDRAVLVGLRWQSGTWQVQLYLGTHLLVPSISDEHQRLLVDPGCAAAEAYFAEELTSTERQAYTQVRFVSGADLSAGCLLQATSAAGGEPVEYFERFGVLLALNRAAHRLHPGLPVADASVQQLARQLALKTTAAISMRFPAK